MWWTLLQQTSMPYKQPGKSLQKSVASWINTRPSSLVPEVLSLANCREVPASKRKKTLVWIKSRKQIASSQGGRQASYICPSSRWSYSLYFFTINIFSSIASSIFSRYLQNFKLCNFKWFSVINIFPVSQSSLCCYIARPSSTAESAIWV